MKVGLLIIPDHIDQNIIWDHNVNYSHSLHIEDDEHEFRTWHSYAAATKGMAMVYGLDKWEKIFECDFVIVVVFSNVYDAIGPIMELKNRGKIVAIAYHEGLQMLQYVIARNIKYMYQLYDVASISECDFVLFSTPKQMGLFWETIGSFENVNVHYVPFAYPVNIQNEYMIQLKDRRGIFISYTDSQSSLMKNGLILLMIASYLTKKHNTHATICAPDSQYKEWFENKDHHRLIIEKPRDYHKFLHMLAKHKICITFDNSLCQGQISFDSAIAGIPCIGGSTDGQRLLYKDLAFDTTNIEKITEIADKCLLDDQFYNNVMSTAKHNMSEKCSFSAVRKKLENLYNKYKESNK